MVKLGGFYLELKQIFELQRNFDRKMGWNRYEKCNTLEDLIDFMQHFVVVTVEELGEIARIRKKFLRDKQSFDVRSLKKELVDMFVYLMQGCMALKMDLETEYMKRLKYNEERFRRGK
jgi:NTP pyrophosphatase (non-canonical NTP hydrolase)